MAPVSPDADAAKARLPRARLRSTLVATLAVASVFSGGCTTRPVVATEPSTNEVFSTVVGQRGVDKVDLLFMIDDSASMGDKQAYFKEAIPSLISRFVTPSCVTADSPPKNLGASDAEGKCPQGGRVEFQPVRDLHLAIVTSSLGGLGGSDYCKTDEENKRGRLVSRAGSNGAAVADAQPSGFVAWFPGAGNEGKKPSDGAVPIDDPSTLQHDFQDIVAGVGESGCGLEAQLESFYRFLIQPDPYDAVDVKGDVASFSGVDKTLLKQRHDFLRPDSLVAVIVLSDENDSAVDPRANGGAAYKLMSSPMTYAPSRGTSACDADPTSSACISCDEPAAAGDPNCKRGKYTTDDPDLELRDNVNLRHVHMKKKFGIDLQYPLSRYVEGLTSRLVPHRDEEHPKGTRDYAGKGSCTNPLFAASLPDGNGPMDLDHLCRLPKGTRDPSLVFYAHIGGVPHELLHFDPEDAKASTLTDADWVNILGKDPDKLDYAGIDPHMIESTVPRPKLAPPSSADGADPIHGREYDSSANALGSDLMFACTFPIARRDCKLAANAASCDCPSKGGVPPHAQLVPLCDPVDPTIQIRAKAYPTIRELHLAKKLGTQGVVSSLCPIHVTPEGDHDLRYGYLPAVTAIVDRLKGALGATCVPHPLDRQADSKVLCSAIEVEPAAGDQSACDALPGRKQPLPAVYARVREQQAADARNGHADLTKNPVCEVVQLASADPHGDGSDCASSKEPGWCYVTGKASGTCAQAIAFTSAGNPRSGASVSLQCIESTSAIDAGKP